MLRCVECNLPVTQPSLVVAMEQRQHFALTRHVEMCVNCASRTFRLLEQKAHESRHWMQSLNCVYCGNNLPITRLRFEIGERIHKHMAICEHCYHAMRQDLLDCAPGMASFIEKEWQTPGQQLTHRMPWPVGSSVRVKKSDKRFGGQYGIVRKFRGLVQPWFGYDVEFAHGVHHFFHERDLVHVETGESHTTPPGTVTQPAADEASPTA